MPSRSLLVAGIAAVAVAPARALGDEPPAPPTDSGPDATEPAGTLTVWVLSPEGPRPEVEVALGLVDAGQSPRVVRIRTGAEGFLRVRSLPAGVVSVEVAVEGAARQVIQVDPARAWTEIVRIATLDVEVGTRVDAIVPPSAAVEMPAPPPPIVSPTVAARDSRAPPSEPSVELSDHHRHGHAMRTAGAALSITGAIVVWIGSIAMLSADSSEHSQSDALLSGLGLDLFGLAALIVGVSFLSIGTSRMREAEGRGYRPDGETPHAASSTDPFHVR